MTFQDAMQALDAGKWVRLRWMTEHDDLWFFAHHSSLPAHWLEGRDWTSEYYSVHLDGFTLENHPVSFPSSIYGADFNERERASDQWEIFEHPKDM